MAVPTCNLVHTCNPSPEETESHQLASLAEQFQLIREKWHLHTPMCMCAYAYTHTWVHTHIYESKGIYYSLTKASLTRIRIQEASIPYQLCYRTCEKFRLSIRKWRQKSLMAWLCLQDHECYVFPEWTPHDLSHYYQGLDISLAAKEIKTEEAVQFMSLSFISLGTDFL